jgi:hypothetical protein
VLAAEQAPSVPVALITAEELAMLIGGPEDDDQGSAPAAGGGSG